MIAVLAGLAGMAQSRYVIDVVCVGAERHYRIDGQPNTTYTWVLTDPLGVDITLPETADTVTIQWDVPVGIYTLSTIQHDTITGCDGIEEFGTIEVIDGATAFAGNDAMLCLPIPYQLAAATATNYSSVLWTTLGDGTFDNPVTLNPVYTFGANDIINGNVALVITAEGLGYAGSCPPAADTIVITLDNLQVTEDITPASCPAVSDGVVQLTASGGTEPYTFIMNSDTNNTGLFTGLAAGDYIYEVTDSNGCTTIDSLRVPLLPALAATVTFTDETYLGANDGTITVNATGGSGFYEYSIDDNLLVWQSSNVFTGLAPGNYSVYVRDSLAPDCWIRVATIEIGTSPALIATFEHTDVTCFGYNDGTITFINPQNGSGEYEYSIDDGGSWSTDSIFVNLLAGNYTLWIRDLNNPSNKELLGQVTILQAVPLTANVTVYPESSPGANDGQIEITAPSGGSGTYEYSLDGMTWQSSPIFTGLVPGSYDVYMRDATYPYCSMVLETVVVPAADELFAQIEVVQITCFGANNGSITLTNPSGGSGFYEYSIDLGSSWQSSPVFGPLGPGIYTLMIRDSLQTTNTHTFESVIITEPAQLDGDVSFTAATCAGNDATITVSNATGGSGFFEYSINGFVWQPDSVFNNLGAGVYMVFLRDSLNPDCYVNLETITVPIDCPLSATLDSTAITCFGAADGSITIVNPQGGTGVYEFSIDGGLTWSSNTTYSPLGPGTYEVIMRDAMVTTLTMNLGTIILSDPAQLAGIVNITHETIPGAGDGSLTVTSPTGGSGTYEYSLDNITWQSSPVFSPLAPGTYGVYIRDANNTDCFVFLGNFTIIPADVLYAEFDLVFITCFGGNDGTITVVNPQGGSGTYEYSLDDGATWQPSNTFGSLEAGTYTVRIRDLANPGNVTILPPVEVTQPDALTAQIVITPVNCNGGNSGAITFDSVSGGVRPYEYSIDEGLTWQADSLFTGLGIGQYIAMLRDSAGCSLAADTVQVFEGVAIEITVRALPSTCGNPNGTIIVSATGGVDPLEYILEGYSTWQSAGTFNNLPAGTYTVKVRDAAKCIAEYSSPVNVQSIEGPQITQVEVWNAVNSQNNGHIVIHAIGGTLPLQYSITGTTWQSSPDFYNLTWGTGFVAYVKDPNGCIDSAYFNVGNVVLGIIELVSGRVTECIGTVNPLTISVINFDSVASFHLQLTYDPDIFQFNGFGDYHNNLLESAVEYSIVAPGILQIIYHHPSGTVSIPDGEMMLELLFEGIAPGLTDLQWEFLECVVYRANGFVEPITAVVNGLAEVLANPAFTAYQDGEYCSGDSTVLRVESGTIDELTFKWRHPRGIEHYGTSWNLGSLTTLDSGNYVVEARSEQCFSLDTVHVTVFPEPDLHIAYTDTLCFGNPVILDPGSGFVDYEWSDGSTLTTIVAYEAGLYWVKIVDFNGCRAIDSVELVPCILEVLVPNAFTPNGDGLNDVFRPLFMGFEPSNYKMDIYNKWGQHIYTTQDLGGGWDGRVNGEPVPVDTFVYIISYEVPSYVLRKGISSPITGRVSVLY